MNEKFSKHFCRFITDIELENEQVITFFDIVQSIVHTKLVTAFDDDAGKVINVEVIAYNNNDENIYEVVLAEDITEEDGDLIAMELDKEFDFEFEFEASTDAQ